MSNTVKLSGSEVDVKNQLTWGEVEQIKSVLMGGLKITGNAVSNIDPTALIEVKFRLLEASVIEIREGGKSFKFNREWMKKLSIEDGEALCAAVDHLDKKKS